jgi:phage host-nuclease inhibitor protein Gam
MKIKDSKKEMEVRKRIAALLRKMARRKLWISKILNKINERRNYWEEKGRKQTANHEAKYREYFQILFQVAEANKEILTSGGKTKTIKFPGLGLIKWYFSKPKLYISDQDGLINFLQGDKSLSEFTGEDKYLVVETEEEWKKVTEALEKNGLGYLVKTDKTLDIAGLEALAVKESKKDVKNRKLLNFPYISYKRDGYFAVKLAEVKAGGEDKKLVTKGVNV